MSETLLVWKPQAGLTQTNAHQSYMAIADGTMHLPDDPVLHAFLTDVLVDLPPLETGSDSSPWSVTPFVADGNIAMGVSGDIINTSCEVVTHALRHGLVVYHADIDKLYDAAWDEAIKLIEEVQTFGDDRIVLPFDIMNIAMRLSENTSRSDLRPHLAAWLDDTNHFIRHIAARALQLMGPPELTDAVIARALDMVSRDAAPNVRAEAIRLLARSGRRDAVLLAVLTRIAQLDDTDYVREEALAVLSAMTQPE